MFGRRGDDYLKSPKGHCYGNQLNLGDVRKRRVERPLLFALAFDIGLVDVRYLHMLSIGSMAILRLHRFRIW